MAAGRHWHHSLTFDAYDEKGNAYTILKYSLTLTVRTAAGTGVTEGPPDFKTNDGRDVNYLKDGRYQIVGRNEILRTDDPEAQ